MTDCTKVANNYRIDQFLTILIQSHISLYNMTKLIGLERRNKIHNDVGTLDIKLNKYKGYSCFI